MVWLVVTDLHFPHCNIPGQLRTKVYCWAIQLAWYPQGMAFEWPSMLPFQSICQAIVLRFQSHLPMLQTFHIFAMLSRSASDQDSFLSHPCLERPTWVRPPSSHSPKVRCIHLYTTRLRSSSSRRVMLWLFLSWLCPRTTYRWLFSANSVRW